MGNFLKTQWGSYVKAFIGILLAYALANGGVILANGWLSLAYALALSTVPLVIKIVTGVKGGFWNTIGGTMAKTFVITCLATLLDLKFKGINWGLLVNTGVVAALTVFANAINPADTRYGRIKS